MRVLDVRVLGHAEALHLHAARHVDRVPGAVVEVRLPEVARALVGRAAPVVAPRAVERLHVGRLGQLGRQRGGGGRERERVGAGRLHVHVVDEFVLPFWRLLGGALRRDGRDRPRAHVRPLRPLRLAQVGPGEAPGVRRDGLQARVDEVAQGRLGRLHVRAVDAHDAVAVPERPGPLRVPRLRRDVEVARERRRVAEHLHVNARHALHLGGQLAVHRLRRGRLVGTPVDPERTRVVPLDRERLRPRRRHQAAHANRPHALHRVSSNRSGV